MISEDKPNPFQVLGLSTDATKAKIVARGQELYDTAETDEQRQLYRWAKEQLLINPRTRLEYELFEPPDTQYENLEWENFIRTHKRSPVRPETVLSPSIEDFDVGTLLQLLLQDMLAVPEADITAAIHAVPFVPKRKPPLEVQDVIFG
jgi:hypothetical protein